MHKLKNFYNLQKKAFTFAELMISLVIIAVITVILYPTIADLSPNNNKMLFKSTYKTIEMIVSEISTTSDIPRPDNVTIIAAGANAANVAAACMCHEFMDRLNVKTPGEAAGAGVTGCAPVSPNICPNGRADYTEIANGNNTFITTNGVRWAFQYDNANNEHEILVDVNASNNEIAPVAANINFVPAVNPRPTNGTSNWDNTLSNIWIDVAQGGLSNKGIYYTNVRLTQDTFLIKVDASVDNAGKINVASMIGYDHMQGKD